MLLVGGLAYPLTVRSFIVADFRFAAATIPLDVFAPPFDVSAPPPDADAGFFDARGSPFAVFVPRHDVGCSVFDSGAPPLDVSAREFNVACPNFNNSSRLPSVEPKKFDVGDRLLDVNGIPGSDALELRHVRIYSGIGFQFCPVPHCFRVERNG